MAYSAIDRSYAIAHFRTKGSKNGQRLYQNPDGSWTELGLERRRSQYAGGSPGSENSKWNSVKANITKYAPYVVGAAAVSAYGYYLYKNEDARNKAAFIAVNAKDAGLRAAGAVGKKGLEVAKKVGQASEKALLNGIEKAGEAFVSGAVVAAAGIVVKKIDDKYKPEEEDSEFVKNRKIVTSEALKSGVGAISDSFKSSKNASNNSNNSNGASGVSADISSKIGPPSNKGVDKQSKRWNDYFQASSGYGEKTKATIKSMSKAGYDLDQIDEYLKNTDVSHSGFSIRYQGNELYHHGIKGQRWGVRRYQNEDGSYTAAGKERYAKNVAYRDKLAKRAGTRAESYTKDLEKTNSKIKDLRENGAKSQVYRDYLAAKARETMAERERNLHKKDMERMDKISRGEDVPDHDQYTKDKYLEAIISSALDIGFTALDKNHAMKEIMSNLEAEADYDKKEAERYLKTQSNLMNMEITALTKRSDIRKQKVSGGLRNVIDFSNRVNNEYYYDED